MISAETVNGTIKVQCGKASGTDLICEAAALVTSVVKTLCADDDKPDVYDEERLGRPLGASLLVLAARLRRGQGLMSSLRSPMMLTLMMMARTIQMARLSPRLSRLTVRLVAS